MKSQMVVTAVLAALMPLSWGFVTKGLAQDRDRDQLKTQQQLQDKDKLQAKDQLQKELKDKGQLHERERERERGREHMQTERPDKSQHERSERGGGGVGRQ